MARSRQHIKYKMDAIYYFFCLVSTNYSEAFGQIKEMIESWHIDPNLNPILYAIEINDPELFANCICIMTHYYMTKSYCEASYKIKLKCPMFKLYSRVIRSMLSFIPELVMKDYDLLLDENDRKNFFNDPDSTFNLSSINLEIIYFILNHSKESYLFNFILVLMQYEDKKLEEFINWKDSNLCQKEVIIPSEHDFIHIPSEIFIKNYYSHPEYHTKLKLGGHYCTLYFFNSCSITKMFLDLWSYEYIIIPKEKLIESFLMNAGNCKTYDHFHEMMQLYLQHDININLFDPLFKDTITYQIKTRSQGYQMILFYEQYTSQKYFLDSIFSLKTGYSYFATKNHQEYTNFIDFICDRLDSLPDFTVAFIKCLENTNWSELKNDVNHNMVLVLKYMLKAFDNNKITLDFNHIYNIYLVYNFGRCNSKMEIFFAKLYNRYARLIQITATTRIFFEMYNKDNSELKKIILS
jgi:hypothetical protein